VSTEAEAVQTRKDQTRAALRRATDYTSELATEPAVIAIPAKDAR